MPKATAAFDADGSRLSSALARINGKVLALQSRIAKFAAAFIAVRAVAGEVTAGFDHFRRALDVSGELNELSGIPLIGEEIGRGSKQRHGWADTVRKSGQDNRDAGGDLLTPAFDKAATRMRDAFDNIGTALPGDIFVQGKGSVFYFPIVTCLVVSGC